MSDSRFGPAARRLTVALALLLALAVGALATGCSGSSTAPGGGGTSSSQGSPKPADPAPAPAPKPTSWVVYINGDDSYSKGSVTYSIAMNLTATNASSDPDGKYTGSATARTTTVGTVNGAPLKASAMVNSSRLEFNLADMALGENSATRTASVDSLNMNGAGSITMKAAGSGTIGRAGGAFGNTSSQQFQMAVAGSQVTMKIPIQGHTYTFHGTISGK
jgi:hypothetical protein